MPLFFCPSDKLEWARDHQGNSNIQQQEQLLSREEAEIIAASLRESHRAGTQTSQEEHDAAAVNVLRASPKAGSESAKERRPEPTAAVTPRPSLG